MLHGRAFWSSPGFRPGPAWVVRPELVFPTPWRRVVPPAALSIFKPNLGARSVVVGATIYSNYRVRWLMVNTRIAFGECHKAVLATPAEASLLRASLHAPRDTSVEDFPLTVLPWSKHTGCVSAGRELRRPAATHDSTRRRSTRELLQLLGQLALVRHALDAIDLFAVLEDKDRG